MGLIEQDASESDPVLEKVKQFAMDNGRNLTSQNEKSAILISVPFITNWQADPDSFGLRAYNSEVSMDLGLTNCVWC